MAKDGYRMFSSIHKSMNAFDYMKITCGPVDHKR